MNVHPNSPHAYTELRDGVRAVVTQFDSRYWQEVDEARAFPDAFVKALTDAGWLSALIPEEYGGSSLSLTEASVVMEEINRAGGNSGACHGQMYVMGCVVRHGSDKQKQDLLPRIARGEIRPQPVESAALAALRQHKPDRPLLTNVEFYTALLLEALGFPRETFTAVFAIGRVGGWIAHAREQATTGKLIRPKSLYVGPESKEAA